MLSETKKVAARINGARSRGPVTPEGKAHSSRNALRHGLLANVIVLPNEDPAVFEDLFYVLVGSFNPASEAEMSMIEELAATTWRVRRACAMEKTILEAGIADRPELSPMEQTTAAFRDAANRDDLNRLHRYETRLQNLYQRTVCGIAHLRKLTAQNTVLRNEPHN
ncbi:MAG: hypothetical protein JWP63_6918 [Candidatus Solibacter sp.]|jgi:hypothetical protein|nr:hypothetical protein [Candidatus Solibacter sp.]